MTDANLVLGRIDADSLLGGRLPLDPERAHAALARLGEQLELDSLAAAEAVIEISNEGMASTIRRVAVERGVDPRDFDLVAFGGAGPLHAAEIAASLGMAGVIVPPHPGLASAFGTLLADRRVDRRWTHYARSDAVDVAALAARLDGDGARRPRRRSPREGFAGEPAVERTLSMRYAGQNHEREVPLAPGPVDEDALAWAFAAFHELHHDVYGYSFPGETLELIHCGRGARAGRARDRRPPSWRRVSSPRRGRCATFASRARARFEPRCTGATGLPAGAAPPRAGRDRGARLDDARPSRTGAPGAPGRHPPALGHGRARRRRRSGRSTA